MRENVASLRRRELAHRAHGASASAAALPPLAAAGPPAAPGDEYLTPLQRKDRRIQELRTELRMAGEALKVGGGGGGGGWVGVGGCGCVGVRCGGEGLRVCVGVCGWV